MKANIRQITPNLLFHGRPTHWKQTLFMLDEPVSVFSGDSITGTIGLHRNPIWRRHMTVTLQWNIRGQTEEADSFQANVPQCTHPQTCSGTFYTSLFTSLVFFPVRRVGKKASQCGGDRLNVTTKKRSSTLCCCTEEPLAGHLQFKGDKQ